MFQLLSEKISGAEGTKLDEDFMEMERKIDVTNKSIFELVSKTTEYLQPNPAYRAKLGMLNTVSKIRGQVKTTGYPQTEGLLGDCMLRYGRELGEESNFGESVEQVSQLAALIEAALDYHKQSSEILEELNSKLQSRITTASNRPKQEFKPKSIMTSLETIDNQQHNGLSYSSSFKSSGIAPDMVLKGSSVHLDQPCCRSLYDFEPENKGELGFKEGDIITLTNQIDENWYEGMIHRESGFFPISYVEVIVPLPQ
ncbi:UNVERIFIED_CONTAM: hypothetical protein FKN15_041449 [Acipenser sinensis]